MQDKNAGLFFFINDSSLAKLPEDAVVGNRIRAHVTQGKIYYNMPEVTEISSIEIINNEVVPIYYENGIYSNNASIGKVYEYTGVVELEPDSRLVGTFSASEELYFHSSTALKAKFSKDMYGRFYGPIMYSYNKYRMEITNENQIKSE